jgi:hypothetical protein
VREQLARDHLSVKRPRLGMDGIQIPNKRAMFAASRFKVPLLIRGNATLSLIR